MKNCKKVVETFLKVVGLLREVSKKLWDNKIRLFLSSILLVFIELIAFYMKHYFKKKITVIFEPTIYHFSINISKVYKNLSLFCLFLFFSASVLTAGFLPELEIYNWFAVEFLSIYKLKGNFVHIHVLNELSHHYLNGFLQCHFCFVFITNYHYWIVIV